MSNPRNLIAKERLSNLRKLDNTSEFIIQVQKLLIDFPKFILGWIELGIAYRKIGDRHEALQSFEQALAYSPNHQKIRLELAEEQLYFRHFVESRQNLQNVLQSNPQNFSAIYKLGKLCQQENKSAEALSFFQTALKLEPEKVDLIVTIVNELWKSTRFEEVEKYLKQGLQYDPNNFRILIKLGELEKVKQQPHKAIFYFQKAQFYHPNKAEPGIKTAVVLRDLQYFEKSEKQLGSLLKKFPNNHNIPIHLGLLEEKKGQKRQALKWFNLAKNIASNLSDINRIKLLIIKVLRDLGDLDEALKIVETILNQDSLNVRAQMLKGQILQEQPNLIAAVEIYKNILVKEFDNLECRIELAKVYSQLGLIERAIATLEEARELLGDNCQLLIQLGTIYQAIENLEKAYQCYLKACSLYPDSHHGYCKLADLFFSQGYTVAAIELLHKAYFKLPNTVQITAKLGELNKYLGNIDLSEKIVKNGLKKFPDSKLLLWQLCHLHLNRGDFNNALKTLNLISADSQDWQRKINKFIANIHFNQYEYQKAEEYFKKTIALTPIATQERVLLASVLMLTGRINQAHRELKEATQELSQKTSVGKLAIPLKSHSAMLVNEMRINPEMMAKLLATQQKNGQARILALGKLLEKDPHYFGTALYLAKELRTQGIFDDISVEPTNNIQPENLTCIPKRIVQFWDEPEPPSEVKAICQSWIDLNPEYEYIRFSFDTAIAFLKQNYGEEVLNAFANCEQPATQADFFRLAYLSKMGGFYADADDKCRQPLDSIISSNPELIIIQENFACIGNNFFGCIPHQKMIAWAFERAVYNMSYYCNESPWLKTGPGLLTSAVCNGLIPYLASTDYKTWPRILILTQTKFRKIVSQHSQLPYKKTDKNWKYDAYHTRVKAIANIA